MPNSSAVHEVSFLALPPLSGMEVRDLLAGLSMLYPPLSIIIPRRPRWTSPRLSLCWIDYILRDGALQLSNTSARRGAG